MRYLYSAILIAIVLGSCSTSKDYLTRSDEDAALFDAVKALNKHANDSNALKAIPVLYSNAQRRHLRIIEGYKSSKELSRWTQILDEYNKLQKMHDAIAESGAASRLIEPANFQSTIYDLKQEAAEEYYSEASIYFAKPGKDDAKTAYTYFKKADKWVPGYKDAKAKMDEAYRNAIVNIVINEIKDNSYFINSGLSNYNTDYNNRYFLQNLVRELGGQNSNRYPARFYTDWEADQGGIQPDLLVNLTLKNMDMQRPVTSRYTQRSSKEVEVGRDTSGNVILQTVYASVNVERQSFTTRAEMELNITDVYTRKNIVSNTYREEYTWSEDHASYNGDMRALSPDDWNMINNNSSNEPNRDQVLRYIYDRIYPQVKNRIIQAVDW